MKPTKRQFLVTLTSYGDFRREAVLRVEAADAKEAEQVAWVEVRDDQWRAVNEKVGHDTNVEELPPEEEEEAMNEHELPLPVALRNDELTEQDFLILEQKALELRSANGRTELPAPEDPDEKKEVRDA